MKYFNYETGLTMINEKFGNLFGQKQRNKMILFDFIK